MPDIHSKEDSKYINAREALQHYYDRRNLKQRNVLNDPIGYNIDPAQVKEKAGGLQMSSHQTHSVSALSANYKTKP